MDLINQSALKALITQIVGDRIDDEDKKELIVNISQSSQNGTHPK